MHYSYPNKWLLVKQRGKSLWQATPAAINSPGLTGYGPTASAAISDWKKRFRVYQEEARGNMSLYSDLLEKEQRRERLGANNGPNTT